MNPDTGRTVLPRASARTRGRRRQITRALRAGTARGCHRLHGADHRRIRHRQGSAGALHPRAVAARQPGPSSRSTARPSPRTCSRPCCLATSAAPSPARMPCTRASSNRPRAARCCWMKSPKCRLSLQAKLLRVLQEREVERLGAPHDAGTGRARDRHHQPSTCAAKCRPAASAKICITDYACSPWRCRRCASGATTCCRLPCSCLHCAAARRADSGASRRGRAPAADLFLARKHPRARQPAAARADPGQRPGDRRPSTSISSPWPLARRSAQPPCCRCHHCQRLARVSCADRCATTERDLILNALGAGDSAVAKSPSGWASAPAPCGTSSRDCGPPAFESRPPEDPRNKTHEQHGN